MAEPQTTSRPKRKGGPGRIPFDLHEPVEYREGRPVSRLDRIAEALRTGGYPSDAAVRAGVTKQGFDEWVRTGTKAQADLLAGRRRLSQLSRHEKQCVEVAAVVVEAEAEARLLLLGLSDKLARGGIKVKTVTEEVRNGSVARRTEKVEETLPDKDMIRFRLERRWPADFGVRRLEVTGADGGPIQTESPLDRLADTLDRIRAQHKALDPLVARPDTPPPTPQPR